MSFLFSQKKNKDSYYLVFNIGSGSVSGGIVKFTEKEGVEIVHYSKELIPFQQELSIPRHLELMQSSLSNLANKIHTEGLKKIAHRSGAKLQMEKAFYFFTSPWSVSQTKIIRLKETQARKITTAYLNDIINKQEKQLEIEISKSGEIIERKIIQIKINGYEVNDIKNLISKDLEIAVFFTVVPNEILQITKKAVSNIFNIGHVWCHSQSLSVFSAIRNLFPLKEDFIHIDVSEEITDVSIIKNNIMVNIASLPFGRNHFIRELSALLNVSEEIADSMIKMHGLKENDESATVMLSESMNKAGKDWVEKLFEVIGVDSEKIHIPETIFLVSNNGLANFLKGELEKKDLHVQLLDYKKIKPKIIGEDLIFKLELMFLDKLYKI